MALIYEPRIFKQFSNIRAALTLRGTTNPPYGFNMSLSVGDDEARVRANRARLANRLGFAAEQLALQRQVHGDASSVVNEGYVPLESDALITCKAAWLLVVSIADCIPVLLCDRRNEVVAGIHSGWRGSRLNITGKTIERLASEYGISPENLFVYVGAAASQCCYEVGDDVASSFDQRHSRPIGADKFLFDNKGVVLDQLLSAGVVARQIEIDPRCTICDPNFHSYRRDGARSGRMIAVIGRSS